MRIPWRSLLPLLGLAAFPGLAEAHPHAWIDLESKVLLDDEGRMRALEEVWLFDDYYTVMVADELAQNDQPTAEYLETIAKRNLANLRDYDYFTVVHFDGKKLPIGDVTRHDTRLVDGRLRMHFEVPLLEPVDPRAGELILSIYDPTYWIEMLYIEGGGVTFSGQGAEACSATVRQPNPTLDQVSLAASLDQTQTDSDGLGALFAETVLVRCR
ncbi:MAG: DUF1007 family protein [Alphaproteobacteria bacterium]